MTDYYDELKLSSSLSTTELYQELNKLESLWRRREVTNPEKAAKMIALIVEAQKKFKDEQSRRDYDLQLEHNKRKPKQFDPYTERLQYFMEWRNKAVSFYDEQQYDLAKSALDKALSYMPTDYEDSLFFNQAALIYDKNNDCNAAMDYINKAIIIDSDIPDYYLTKGLVFNTMANGQYVDYSDKQTFHEKSEKMFLKAHELAARKNISVVRANAAGVLSRYYSFINDEAKAENFAQEAVQYGETWGNGQKVLDNIKRAQQERQRREEEACRRREEEKRRAEEYRRKCEEEKQERERQKREHAAAIAKRRNLYIIGWFVWVICQAVNGPIFFNSLVGASPEFMSTPLFLSLAVVGTTFPSYVESAYIGYRGFLGSCCIFSIIMYCVYTQYVSGVSFFALLIVLVVLQIASWLIGGRHYMEP